MKTATNTAKHWLPRSFSLPTFCILSIVFLFLFSFFKASAFSDVTKNHEHFDAINYLKGERVIQGYSDGSYKPTNLINRAEFTKIIVGAVTTEEDRAPYKQKKCFSDVEPNKWYTEYICYAKAMGFVEGYSDNTYKPHTHISFPEAAKIINKGLALGDKQGNDPWWEHYVQKLSDLKSIPTSIETLYHAISRAEMAEIIYRIKTQKHDKETLSINDFMAQKEMDSFDSCADLASALNEKVKEQKYRMDYMLEDAVETSAPASKETSAGASDDYSTTNIQVQGVDEADIIKNDGKYIYMIKGDEVRIIRAYPVENMLEISRFKMEDPSFHPQQLFLRENQLIVIGNTSTYKEHASIIIDPYFWEGYHTAVYIYDITDRKTPILERDFEFYGDISTSRRIDNTLYLILNKYVYLYQPLPEESEDIIIPQFRDSERTDTFEPLTTCGDIRHIPHTDDMNYIMLIAIPLDDKNADIESETILGSSETVYASTKGIYIVKRDFDNHFRFYDIDDDSYEEKTRVYKWNIDNINIKYVGSTTVPGTVLNQFSMDEYNNHFRIATTKGNVWDEETLSSNNVYILDNDLTKTGQIENIAPGERIYSVRFMGKKAYMVTFKKVDPLFVIDVENPHNPKILGKLKIPGYSDYLHPYDENHIIGFGKDTVEAEEELKEQRNIDFAWYQGMKIALFDVTDVEAPKELFKEIIGDRGTDSELLRNHKALLFDREKNLLAFPITVYEIEDKENKEGNTYGEPVFQGAYVYKLDTENGFQLQGKITHHDDDEAFLKSGYYFHGGENQIDRIIYISKYLYTISQNLIKASSMETIEEANRVEM